MAVTDTTFRDAHQSLLATRVRTRDLVAVAPTVARQLPELLSVEAWGGATYDVALRFLAEDPWERLDALSGGGAEHLPADAAARPEHRGLHALPGSGSPTRSWPRQRRSGIDIFRIFDALNDIEQMRPAIDAVRDTGTAVAEVALCYTADLSDPAEKLYTLDYYLRLAERIVEAGAHVLAIKDMAGLLRAPAAVTLVSALRERFDLPVHLHTHDTAGGQLATYLAATAAGVDAVDVAARRWPGPPPSRRCPRWSPRPTTREWATGLSLAAVPGPGTVLGGGARRLRAVRVGAAGADRAGLPARDPRRAAVQPAAAGDRARPGRKVRGDRGDLRRRRRHARPAGQGDAVVEGGRRPGAAPGRRRSRARRSSRPTRAATTSRTPSSDSSPANSVTRRVGGRNRSAPRRWPVGPSQPAVTELSAEDADGAARHAPADPQPAAVPRAHPDFEAGRGTSSATSSCCRPIDYLYGLQPRHGARHPARSRGSSCWSASRRSASRTSAGLRTVVTTLNGQLRPLQIRDRSVAVDVPVAERADPGNPSARGGAVRGRGHAGRRARVTRSPPGRSWRPSRR